MYRALSQHPVVLKAVLHKGVHYFDMDYARGIGWYQGHFPLKRARALGRAIGRHCRGDFRVEPLLHVPPAGRAAHLA